MLSRFVIYGLLGWCLEILFNGVKRFLRARDWRLPAQTSLWMFPIYGLIAPIYEPLHDAVRAWPFPARGCIYLLAFWAVEYASGWLIRRAFGVAPWDYSHARWNLHGLIRADFAPVFFVYGLFLEPVHDLLVRLF